MYSNFSTFMPSYILERIALCPRSSPNHNPYVGTDNASQCGITRRDGQDRREHDNRERTCYAAHDWNNFPGEREGEYRRHPEGSASARCCRGHWCSSRRFAADYQNSGGSKHVTFRLLSLLVGMKHRPPLCGMLHVSVLTHLRRAKQIVESSDFHASNDMHNAGPVTCGQS